MTQGPALLLIDAQEAFRDRRARGHVWGNPGAETQIAALLAAFRAAGLPVIHVHHDGPDPTDPFRLDRPSGQPMPAAMPLPGEPVVVKHTSSAFVATELADRLAALGNPPLVIAGGAANYCVDTTTRMAADLGYRARIAEDALINFGNRLRDGRDVSAADVLAMTLADLDGEFATVLTTDQILADLG